MTHMLAEERTKEAEDRAKARAALTPAEGTRGGLSESYFDKLAEDAKREGAK